jgi:hypothetical protein
MTDDPLRDPHYPERPQHPDFWRLSDTVLHLTLYLDAFLLGVGYQERGGHR